MPRLSAALAAMVSLIASACTVHSTRAVDRPSEIRALIGRDGSTQVRLISATGKSTGWLPGERLVAVGGNLCLRSTEPPWKRITAVRVSHLTDANIAAILAELPRSIRVVHLGGGEARLETGGRDLTRWLRSVAHDPADVGIPRYHVEAWQVWLGPLTWAELAGVDLRRIGQGSWEVEGGSGALRAWLREHLRAIEDAHRNFIDLPAVSYATRTSLGWGSVDADSLAELARETRFFGERPQILVGWRWSKIDRIGPCPLTGAGKPLLTAAAR